MKKTVLIALTCLLAVLGVYCGWRYYHDAWLPNKQLSDAIESQKELLRQLKPNLDQPDGLSSAPNPEDGAGDTRKALAGGWSASLAKLKEFNPEAVGWLTIPGTTVDYPIVQAKDNELYLTTGFDRQHSDVGCPFMDARCDSSFGGFNSIVYAHHIDQEMFGDIALYKDSGFMEARPSGVLLAEDGVHDVLFFAYLTTFSTSKVYDTVPQEKADCDSYIDFIFDQAGYTRELTAEELKSCDSLRLLVLSTCTYEFENARGVLVGVIR